TDMRRSQAWIEIGAALARHPALLEPETLLAQLVFSERSLAGEGEGLSEVRITRLRLLQGLDGPVQVSRFLGPIQEIPGPQVQVVGRHARRWSARALIADRLAPLLVQTLRNRSRHLVLQGEKLRQRAAKLSFGQAGSVLTFAEAILEAHRLSP